MLKSHQSQCDDDAKILSCNWNEMADQPRQSHASVVNLCRACHVDCLLSDGQCYVLILCS